MMEVPRRRVVSLNIELSPLIDCVFLLLIFFMLNSTLLAPAIDLKLPKAGSGGVVRAPEIVVTITREQRCLLNGTEIPLESLSEQLGPLVRRSKRKVVTYRGDAGSTHGTFVRVLDAARSAGADHVDVSHDLEGASDGSDSR